MNRNIVFICLDTVRKDYFDNYMPRIQSLVDTTFSQCRAVSSWSPPSHASQFTGQLPHQHDVHTHRFTFDNISINDVFLSDIPIEQSVGFSANTYASTTLGFGKLFDQFHEYSYGSLFPDGLHINSWQKSHDFDSSIEKYRQFVADCVTHQHTLKSAANALHPKLPLPSSLSSMNFTDDGAASISKDALRYSEDIDEPFFMFINFMDAHTPHRPHKHLDDDLYSVPKQWSTGGIPEDHDEREEYLSNYRQLYRASIDYLDRIVSDFVSSVSERTSTETTFIITSDHGENLGLESDRGLLGHGLSLSEGLLHTPLSLINPPENYPEIENRFFSQIYFPELIKCISGGEMYSDALFSSPTVAERVGGRKSKDRMLRCYYDGNEKIVWDSDGMMERYDLDEDQASWERLQSKDTDSIPEYDELFEVGIKEYKSKIEGIEEPEIDSDTEKRLKELGYM